MNITINQIIDEVCAEFMVTKSQILASRRCERHAKPRKIVHWLCYRLTEKSLTEIGRVLKRDHTTVYASYKSVEEEIEKGSEIGNLATDMLRRIHAKSCGQHISWMQTASGKAFFPLDPRPSDVEVDDIAHALSHLCRYAGHTRFFYSVAQHSVLVSRTLPDHLKLWGLLHDASEAYLADIPAPLKPHLTGYREIEMQVMWAICTKFGLTGKMPEEVKRVDMAILADERNQLMAKPPRDWKLTEPALGIKIDYWPPEVARAEFLKEFYRLTANRKAAA